ncbi:MAG TPA: bacteriohopanetetrol glucosamine biosynthesis glycosyltransferase HpnI [Terriglobales bacterium]|jgi:ceramide glucosyltransferase
MVHWITLALEIIATLGTISSLTYYLVSSRSAAQFHAEQIAARSRAFSFMPPISILKPLKGIDPGMYESFRSHCLQDYPQYEILFGVSEANDPALTLVEQLKIEFPEREIRVVCCDRNLGTNIKVSNLAQMLPEARYEHLLVNDSDIRVEAQYLKNVIAPLENEMTGLVTCLYRGNASATLGSRLEALCIGTDFAAGVLTARSLEGGIRFGMGSTLAFRRADVKSVGGFEAILDYLADDYQLGHRLAAAGKKVALSETVVETSLPAYSLRDFWRHQLRWARTIRDSRRSGHLGLIFTFGLPWALLTALLAHGAPWAWGLLAATVALRVVQAVTTGRLCLQDRQIVRLLWLLPLRDLIAAAIWVASLLGHTIRWRGKLFYLRQGKLVRAAEQ